MSSKQNKDTGKIVKSSKNAIEAIRKIPLLSEKDIAEIRAHLCNYDPKIHDKDKVLNNLQNLPDITGEDVARVRAALCLYDPER